MKRALKWTEYYKSWKGSKNVFIKAEDKLEKISAQLAGLGVEFNVLTSSSFLVEILEQWRSNMWHKLFELVEW